MEDVRIATLRRCYAMEGYKDLPLKEKNKVYDREKMITLMLMTNDCLTEDIAREITRGLTDEEIKENTMQLYEMI